MSFVSYGTLRASDKVSSLNVKFFDVNDDIRAATKVFPEPSSQLAAALKVLEGEPRHADFELESVVNPYLAHSIAVNQVCMSHRKIGRVVCTIDAFPFEVGDIARLVFPREHIDDYIRITRRQVIGFTVVLDVMEFHPIDYSYQPGPVETVDLPSVVDLAVPVPTNLQAVVSDQVFAITWDISNARHVGGYEVEVKIGAGDWAEVASTADATVRHALFALVEGEHSYAFRVRSLGLLGGFSDWVETAAIEAERPVPVPAENLLDQPDPPVLTPRDQALIATWEPLAGVDYQLRLRKSSPFNWRNGVVKDIGAGGRPPFAVSPQLLDMLTNGQGYVAIIRKWIGDRKSPWSRSSGSRPVAPPPVPTDPEPTDTPLAKPDTPTLEAGDETLTAYWTPAEGVVYELQYRSASAAWADAGEVTTINPAVPPQAIDELTNGQAYAVRIRARQTTDGSTTYSPYSDDASGTPVEPEPVAPTPLQTPVLTLTPITNPGIPHKVLATWTASPGATRYCVEVKPTAQDRATGKVQVVDGTSVALGSNWGAGSLWDVRVQAEDQASGNASAWSDWVGISVPVKVESNKPGVPRDGDRVIGDAIDSYTTGYDDLTLDIKAPRASETVGRAERMEYRYKRGADSEWGDWTTYPTGLTALGTSRLAAAYDLGDSEVDRVSYRLHLTELDHDTPYDLQVRAVNSVGESAAVDVSGIRTEGLRSGGETAYWGQSAATPSPRAPAGGQQRYITNALLRDGPPIAFPSAPTWIDAWSAGTAYSDNLPSGAFGETAAAYIGDLVRITNGAHTRIMECETTHTAAAGGLTLSASGVLGGTQIGNWKPAHWNVAGRAPTDLVSWWFRTSRGLTFVPTWFANVTHGAFASTQAFASGAAAPTGTSGKWYLQTGTAPALWYLNGTAWVRILDSVTYGADAPTASAGDVYVQTTGNIVWRHISGTTWVRIVDPRLLFGTDVGTRTVAGEKYATVRSTDALDDYLDDSTVNQVLHLSSRSVSAGVLAGIFYAKVYLDDVSSVISALPLAAEGQAFEVITATQAGGVVTIEARPKTGNTAGARQTMRRFFEADHAVKVGDWQALFADADTSTDTGSAWRWTFNDVAAGTVSPTATLQIVEAAFRRYEAGNADAAIHMVYFESSTWGAPVNYRMPPAAAPVIQTASGTVRDTDPRARVFDYAATLQATATGGTAPLTFTWRVFVYQQDPDDYTQEVEHTVATGTGSAITLALGNPARIHHNGGQWHADLTVTDSASPAKSATRRIVLSTA